MNPPEPVAARSARAQTYRELKAWLRTLPVTERVRFLNQLAQSNERFSLHLTKSARLSPEALTEVLQNRLSGNPKNAILLIQYFEPLLGSRRFWRLVTHSVRPESMMFQSLDRFSGGRLTHPTTGWREWGIPHLGWYAFAVLMVFATFALATAPAWLAASLVGAFSGGKVALEDTSGSLWTGRAATIIFTTPDGVTQRFENLSWQVSTPALVRAHAVVRVELSDPRLSAEAMVDASFSRISVSQLRASAQAPLAASFVPIVNFWKPRGTLRVAADELTLKPIGLVSPATVDWQGAALNLSDVAPLGDYRLRIQPDRDTFKLNLETVTGALQVVGTGQYSPAKGGEFRYTALASLGYTDQLAPLVDIMGRKEADGTVTFQFQIPPLK
jgi:general secretion pathway protein N